MDRPAADAAYFLRRANEERVAAMRTIDPRVRQIHLDLAERYAEAARANETAKVSGETEPASSVMARLLTPELRIIP